MKKIITLFTFTLIGLNLFSQTSPEPIYLIAGDGAIEYTPYNEGTYPYGLNGWVGTNPEVAPNSPVPKNIQAKGDGPLVPIASMGGTGHWSSYAINNEGNGISLRAATTGNATPLAIVMALNTKGCTGVKVGFTWGCKTNYVNSGKAAICFQYRVGNSGDWNNDSEDSQARFSSTKTAQVKEPKTITLPASCDNQELVQVRWLLVRETPAAVGGGDRMHVDAITYKATTRAAEVPPVASFSYTNDTTVVNFKNESQNIPTSFIWDFGDSSELSTLSNPKHIYSKLDNYKVTLIVSNSKGSDTLTKMVNLKSGESIEAIDDNAKTDKNTPVLINVLANDLASSIDSAGLTIAMAPSNGIASISNNKILYEPNLDFEGMDSFMYKVCTTPNKNACDSAMVFVTVGTTGISQNPFDAQIQLYPNPSTGKLFFNVINNNAAKGNFIYELLNANGVKIISQRINSGSQHLDFSSLSNGVYYLKVIDNKQNFKTEKVVIIK